MAGSPPFLYIDRYMDKRSASRCHCRCCQGCRCRCRIGQRCVGGFLTIAGSRTDGEFRIGDAHRFVLSHSCQSVRVIACLDALDAVNALLQSWRCSQRCSQRCQWLRWLAPSEPERLREGSSAQPSFRMRAKGKAGQGEW